jgi:glucose-like phosphotransferase system IIB component
LATNYSLLTIFPEDLMREFLRTIGRSLLLPLAVLPFAAALILLGPSSRTNLPLVEAGAMLIQLLPLFFAIGLALGNDRPGAGVTILAVIIGYALVMLAAQGVILALNYLATGALLTEQWHTYALIAGFSVLCYLLIFLLVRMLGLRSRKRRSEKHSTSHTLRTADAAGSLIYAFGGKENIVRVDNCATRLLLTVKDSSLVDGGQLKTLGVSSVVVPSDTSVQATTGRATEYIAAAMREHLPSANGSPEDGGTPASAEQETGAGSNGASLYDPAVSASVLLMIKALGGQGNIVDAGEIATTRLRVVVRDDSLVNEEALRASGASGVMVLGNTFHILLGMRAGLYVREMQLRLDELRATA